MGKVEDGKVDGPSGVGSGGTGADCAYGGAMVGSRAPVGAGACAAAVGGGTGLCGVDGR